MSKLNNLFLIGPMGAGKTTIGRRLAKELAKAFYDSDHEIERHTGADIPLIFEIEGEQGFREREAKLLATMTERNNIVLSTGGGAVLDPDNQKLLSKNGYIVYLKSTPEKLYKRTAGDKRRPLLQTDERMEQIKNILTEREPIYSALADKIIYSDDLNIKEILQQIIDSFNDYEKN